MHGAAFCRPRAASVSCSAQLSPPRDIGIHAAAPCMMQRLLPILQSRCYSVVLYVAVARETEESQLRGLPPIQPRRAGGDDANLAKKDGEGSDPMSTTFMAQVTGAFDCMTAIDANSGMNLAEQLGSGVESLRAHQKPDQAFRGTPPDSNRIDFLTPTAPVTTQPPIPLCSYSYYGRPSEYQVSSERRRRLMHAAARSVGLAMGRDTSAYPASQPVAARPFSVTILEEGARHMGITAPRCGWNRLGWAYGRSGQGVSTPKFIPFDPSQLAFKPPRKRKPNVDPYPHMPWTDIDDIAPEELDLTGLEPGPQSPEDRLSSATTRDVDRTQSDTGGKIGFTQRKGSSNGSRSPTALDTREEDGDSTALKGSSLDEPLVIEEDGSENDSEAESEAEPEDELPSSTSPFNRRRGPDRERSPTQADNSAQSNPGAVVPDSIAEDIDDGLDSLFEDSTFGESDGDDDDGVDNKPFGLSLTDAELDDGQLRQDSEADDRIVSSQAHDSARQSDQAAEVATTAGHSQSPEPEGGVDSEDVLELETDSHGNRVGMNQQSVRPGKGKRKHSLSTDPIGSVAQTLDSSMEAPIHSSHSAKRLRPSHRHRGDISASSNASTPNLTPSHRRSETTADMDDGQVGNGDGDRAARNSEGRESGNGEDGDKENDIDDVYDTLEGESNAGYPVDDDRGSRHSLQAGQRQRSVTSTWQQTPSSSRANSADPKPAKNRRRHRNNNPASGDVHTRSRRIATSLRRPQTASASTKSRGLAIDRNGVGASPQDPLYKVIDITLRPVSTGVSFLAATIQAAGDSVAFSHSEPATLLSEVLGQGGMIEGVTLKTMPSSGLWMLTGFRRVDVCDPSGPVASTETRPAPTDEMCPSDSLEQRAWALCSLAANAKGGETMVEEEVEQEEGVSDGGFGARDDDDCAGHAVHRGARRSSRAQTRRPWKELDEQRLLAWKRENKPWKWIFSQFPDRTKGAIRVRVHMLQKAQQSRRSQRAEALED
ncbi:hypothetical protein EJ08DRAFT_659634 [Tothia fuscella]|uniref:Myb-like domain-containing protein n=1 Tax=Tothia fuscella TaxID=1048955 RepID=A0A9P4NUI0_9PEZI|nr:hypothetical protein EJ08DRAFT_659634 [Tothia fuscella]